FPGAAGPTERGRSWLSPWPFPQVHRPCAETNPIGLDPSRPLVALCWTRDEDGQHGGHIVFLGPPATKLPQPLEDPAHDPLRMLGPARFEQRHKLACPPEPTLRIARLGQPIGVDEEPATRSDLDGEARIIGLGDEPEHATRPLQLPQLPPWGPE